MTEHVARCFFCLETKPCQRLPIRITQVGKYHVLTSYVCCVECFSRGKDYLKNTIQEYAILRAYENGELTQEEAKQVFRDLRLVPPTPN